MLPPPLRILVAAAVILYCSSRLVVVCRQRVCVSFLGLKYYRSERKVYYWLVIMAHVWLSLVMVLNIVRDWKLL